jgi:hypothetical protein
MALAMPAVKRARVRCCSAGTSVRIVGYGEFNGLGGDSADPTGVDLKS